jgi:cytochrome c biogenesis protein CcmG/thiol:disulfide interchange protein DsbE
VAESSVGELRSTTPRTPWRGRRWLFVAIAIGVLALLGLLFWGMQRGPRTTVGTAAAINRPAPNFTVTTLDGQQLTMSELRGKTVVLNVWASWCDPCKQEAGELNRAYAQYQGRNVAFIGIAFNDDTDPMREFVARYGVPYPVALDPEGKISIDLGITGVPETYIITPDGQMTQKWIGPITAKQLATLLAPLVP